MQDALARLADVLDRARLPDRAADEHRGRRRHAQPGDVPAGAGAGAVAGRLRRAVACAPTTPGTARTRTGCRPTPSSRSSSSRSPGNPQELYLGSLDALGIDVRRPRRPVRRGQLGLAGARRLGPGLGGLARRPGDHPVHLLPAGRRRQPRPGVGGDHLRHRAHPDGAAGRRATSRTSPTRRASPTARCSARPSTRCRRYYLDDADVATNRRLFDVYAAEAQRMIDARLPVPAHTLRAEVLPRLQRAGRPRRGLAPPSGPRAFAPDARGWPREVAAAVDRPAARSWATRSALVAPPAPPAPAGRRPRRSHRRRARCCSRSAPRSCRRAEVDATAATPCARRSPRRLAAHPAARTATVTRASPRRGGWSRSSTSVAAASRTHERTVRGPKVSAAFDADGDPTQAAAGFARGQGVDVADLQRPDVNGVEHVGGRAARRRAGRPPRCSPSVLGAVVTGLRVGRRTCAGATRACRSPARSAGCSPCSATRSCRSRVGALAAGRTTRVHRTAAEPVVDRRPRRGRTSTRWPRTGSWPTRTSAASAIVTPRRTSSPPRPAARSTSTARPR